MQCGQLKRRTFITLIGGGAVAWPLAARAQQLERMRRIGVLMSTTANDPEGQARIAAFVQGLQQVDWIAGRNRGSIIAGRQAMTPTLANTRRNWSRSRRMSSWLVAARLWDHCCRRPAPCRLCSCSSLIRSALATSIAWRGRGATPPVSYRLNTV